MNKQNDNLKIPNYLKFVFGGLAGVGAVCCTHPVDLLKTRAQANKESRQRFKVVFTILKSEGISGLYSGLSAGILRQAVYTTSRLGLYTSALETTSRYFKKDPPFGAKVGLGLIAGGIASLIGTPADVALVRMTTDGRLPEKERCNYRNVFHALYSIVRKEGFFNLWRGCWPTVCRAMVGNATQLAVYSQMKRLLTNRFNFRENFSCHFLASLVSSFSTAVTILPFDIAKTRIQMRRLEDSGTIRGVWSRIVKSEGFFCLWKGFTPYVVRSIPHGILIFIFMEQMNIAYCKFVLKCDQSPRIL